MRKNVFGRQLKRDSNERKALFKGLLSALVLQEKIITTEEKVKAIRGQADKIVTIGKKGGLHAFALLGLYLNPEAKKKLVNEIAPRFGKRHGGYTTMARLGNRLSDNAAMSVLAWMPDGNKLAVVTKAKAKDVKMDTEEKEEKTEEKKPSVAKKPRKKAKTA